MVPVVAANARVSLSPFAIVYIIILLHHWYNKYLIVNGDANTLVSDVMETSVYREVSCARMQTGRSRSAAANVNGQVFLVGGLDQDDVVLDSVELLGGLVLDQLARPRLGRPRSRSSEIVSIAARTR